MATHCQTATQSGSSERQNSGAVNSFWGKKGGAVNSNYEHSLYFIRYMAFFNRQLFRRLWVTFVDNFVMRMFDLGGGGGGL